MIEPVDKDENPTGERDVIILMIRQLVEQLGDHTDMTIDIEILLNATAAMAGILIKAIPEIEGLNAYQNVANHLESLMVNEAEKARQYRLESGYGLLDLALSDTTRFH